MKQKYFTHVRNVCESGKREKGAGYCLFYHFTLQLWTKRSLLESYLGKIHKSYTLTHTEHGTGK